MREDDAHYVIGALLLEPNALAPTAYSLLRPDDFEDEEHRFLFEQLIDAWELTCGDFAPGPLYRRIIVAALIERFGLAETSAWNALSDLEGYGGAATHVDVFQWHCERLLAASALCRLRGAIGGYYMRLSDAWRYRWDGEGGRIDIRPRLYVDHLDAHEHMEALVAEITEAMKRTPRAPPSLGTAKRRRKQGPVGTW